ncbi:MAG: hypothetical protein CMJ75_03335 [Planctomycetaceae bacterium]|nr:hypothetical protein [Planctomycetaceae bacterium]
MRPVVLTLLLVLVSLAEGQQRLLDYDGRVLPAQASPAWKHHGGRAVESIVDGRWVVRDVSDFSRMVRLADVKTRYERQLHELSFQWSSTAHDTFAADGMSVQYAGRRFRLFPILLPDGRSVLLTGTLQGCLLSEPSCHVKLPEDFHFDAAKLNQYRVRWTTNRANDYGFELWVNRTRVGILPGEILSGRGVALAMEFRSGRHVVDDVRWSVLEKGIRLVDVRTGHALEQLAQGRRQLFLDNALIASRSGLKRVVNPPEKYQGNPVVRANQAPWQTFRAQLYGTVLYIPEERKFKMWYLAAPRFPWEPPVTKDGRQVCPNFQFTAYAESTDGFHWDLPELGLVDYNGSRKNNICKLATECAEGVAVVYDPRDQNPSRRYKAFYWEHAVPYQGSPVKPINGMSVAFSADGKLWTEHPANPVIDQASDSGQQALWDPDHNVFRSFGRFGAGGRKVAMSQSVDFLDWSPSRLVLAADEKDGPRVQVYGMGTTFYEGLFVGLPWMFHEGTTEKLDVELAISRDRLNWHRVADRTVFIPNGKPHEWDAGIIFTASQPLQVVGNTIFVFYSAVQGDHAYNALEYAQPGDADYQKFRQRATASIGVATIRRDGFVSLDAGAEGGKLVTHVFPWPGDTRLHINADLTEGEMVVEVIDKAGKVCACSDVMRGNHYESEVDFDRALATTPQASLQLRFRISNGKFYSFWFK